MESFPSKYLSVVELQAGVWSSKKIEQVMFDSNNHLQAWESDVLQLQTKTMKALLRRALGFQSISGWFQDEL